MLLSKVEQWKWDFGLIKFKIVYCKGVVVDIHAMVSSKPSQNRKIKAKAVKTGWGKLIYNYLSVNW